jgi:hypothetical protein
MTPTAVMEDIKQTGRTLPDDESTHGLAHVIPRFEVLDLHLRWPEQQSNLPSGTTTGDGKSTLHRASQRAPRKSERKQYEHFTHRDTENVVIPTFIPDGIIDYIVIRDRLHSSCFAQLGKTGVALT